MGDNQQQQNNNNNNGADANNNNNAASDTNNDDWFAEQSFQDYVATTDAPGTWLFITTTALTFAMVLFIVPVTKCLLRVRKRRRRKRYHKDLKAHHDKHEAILQREDRQRRKQEKAMVEMKTMSTSGDNKSSDPETAAAYTPPVVVPPPVVEMDTTRVAPPVPETTRSGTPFLELEPESARAAPAILELEPEPTRTAAPVPDPEPTPTAVPPLLGLEPEPTRAAAPVPEAEPTPTTVPALLELEPESTRAAAPVPEAEPTRTATPVLPETEPEPTRAAAPTPENPLAMAGLKTTGLEPDGTADVMLEQSQRSVDPPAQKQGEEDKETNDLNDPLDDVSDTQSDVDSDVAVKTVKSTAVTVVAKNTSNAKGEMETAGKDDEPTDAGEDTTNNNDNMDGDKKVPQAKKDEAETETTVPNPDESTTPATESDSNPTADPAAGTTMMSSMFGRNTLLDTLLGTPDVAAPVTAEAEKTTAAPEGQQQTAEVQQSPNDQSNKDQQAPEATTGDDNQAALDQTRNAPTPESAHLYPKPAPTPLSDEKTGGDGYTLMEKEDYEMQPHLLRKATKLMAVGGKFDDLKQHRKLHSSLRSILRYDRESRRLVQYAAPFTFYAVAETIFESITLALVGHFVGTKQMAAIAIVQILVGLTDGILDGPHESLTTLCAHAVGADNTFLAGKYAQLSMVLHFVLGVPVNVLWAMYIDDVILYLDWGDESVAHYALVYTRIAVWGGFIEGAHHTIGELLEVTDHEIFTTAIGLLEGAVNIGMLVLLIWLPSLQADWLPYDWKFHDALTLEMVAIVGVATSFVFFVLAFSIASYRGWLKPFAGGLFGSFALFDRLALFNVLKTSVPLSFGKILDEATWTVMTFFAASMGEAEVAAWAILLNIWEVIESLSLGIGDAAEIRISYHLGNNHPFLAKITAYKSMLIAMVGSVVVAGVFYGIRGYVPAFFTIDETLQGMMEETLPYIAVGSLATTFVAMYWYMLGAQGRFKLATIINFVTSWTVTLPLGYYFTYYLNYDIQGLVAALVLGYIGTGIVFTVVFMKTNWVRRARKISTLNAEEEDSDDEDDDDDEDDFWFSPIEERAYLAFASRKSRAARSAARDNSKLLISPPGVPLGLDITLLPRKEAFVVVGVDTNSPFHNRVYPGDIVLSIDGLEVTKNTSHTVLDCVNTPMDTPRRVLIMTTPYHYRDEQTEATLVHNTVPDIPDCDDTFDEDEMDSFLT